MSKAAKLLKKTLVATDKAVKSSSKFVVPSDRKVELASFGRETTLKAAGRYFKALNRKIKSLTSELGVVKGAIRVVGQNELDAQFARGVYFSESDCGGVKVTRANKFKPAPYDRDALKDAVGESYGAMFQEDAGIKFASVDALRTHVQLCQDAGISIDGEVSESVKGRSGLRQRMCEMWAELDEDRRELLTVCAQDQAPRVGGGR